jgi:hypothetical protein
MEYSARLWPWPKYVISIAWIIQGVYTPHNHISDYLEHKKTCDLHLAWKQTNAYVCTLGFQTAVARLCKAPAAQHPLNDNKYRYVSGARLEVQMGLVPKLDARPGLETWSIYI